MLGYNQREYQKTRHYERMHGVRPKQGRISEFKSLLRLFVTWSGAYFAKIDALTESLETLRSRREEKKEKGEFVANIDREIEQKQGELERLLR